MPWIAFIANGLWVLVIGLMGPSVPFIIEEFSLDYSQAGLIFTLLSIGAFFGVFAGGLVSDYRKRKFFWLIFLLCLCSGLILFGLSVSFTMMLAVVFLMSLFGSPIGAVGQSVMLQMFPERRGEYLSLSTMFAAAGSLIAPFLIILPGTAGLSWHCAFFSAAVLAAFLFFAVAATRLPEPLIQNGGSLEVIRLFLNHRLLFAGMMVFFSVGLDVGFSYWLAEYFVSRVGIDAGIAGTAVACYLAGIISGRFINSRRPENISPWLIPSIGLIVACASLLMFLNADGFFIKLLFCFLYGLGLGPVFPAMMSVGTALYPERSGAVTAVLFSFMSLSGAVFPVLIGSYGSSRGIEPAYYLMFALAVPVAAGLAAGKRIIKKTDST